MSTLDRRRSRPEEVVNGRPSAEHALGPSVREYLNLANALTSGSLVCGLLAVILATQGEFVWGAGVVGVAAALDGLDGPAARRVGGGPDGFGSRLDSLADVLSFGAAPALALHLSLLHEAPVVGTAACLAFLLCGAWRLARFSVVKRPCRFIGLPIPPAGLVAVLLAALQPPLDLAVSVTVGLAVLMISEVPFPTLAPARRSRGARQSLR